MCKDCSSNSHKGIPKRRLELSGKCRQRTNIFVSRLFRLPVPSVSSMCLFHQSVPSVCSISLFHQSVPSVCSTCLRLFHQSVPYICSIRLFHTSVSPVCSISMFHTSVPSVYFCVLFCLQFESSGRSHIGSLFAHDVTYTEYQTQNGSTHGRGFATFKHLYCFVFYCCESFFFFFYFFFFFFFFFSFFFFFF